MKPDIRQDTGYKKKAGYPVQPLLLMVITSIIQRNGCEDPDLDPYINETDPKHWFLLLL